MCVGREMKLCFANAEAGSDTYLGFSDSTWHTHGALMLMTGSDTYVELDPIEVLERLKSGDILIASRHHDGKLSDRWLFHRKAKQDFQYFEADESVTIQKADLLGTNNSGASSARV